MTARQTVAQVQSSSWRMVVVMRAARELVAQESGVEFLRCPAGSPSASARRREVVAQLHQRRIVDIHGVAQLAQVGNHPLARPAARCRWRADRPRHAVRRCRARPRSCTSTAQGRSCNGSAARAAWRQSRARTAGISVRARSGVSSPVGSLMYSARDVAAMRRARPASLA